MKRRSETATRGELQNAMRSAPQNFIMTEDRSAEVTRQRRIGSQQDRRMKRVENSLRHSPFDARPTRFIFTALFCGLVFLILHSSAAMAHTCKDSIPAGTPDSNYTIHPDGTVSDNTTGLMWMRCGLGQKWDKKKCSGTPKDYTWKDALLAADSLEFAGYSDWRLPSKNELESIVEERCYSPAINDKVFPDTPSVFFWSSSPFAGFSGGAWSVDFGFGAVNASDKDGAIPVRLVRDEQ